VSRKGQRRSDESASAGESSGAGFWDNLQLAAPVISAGILLLLLAASVAGLERLKRYVGALPQQKMAVKVELEVPAEADWVDKEGWRPRILSAIHVPEEQVRSDQALLRDVARQMERSGWVSQVRRVMRTTDGTIRILCDYRRPIAMLLDAEGEYVPVDRQGCRLPEVYTSVSDSGAWIQILGVQESLPPVGQEFRGEDARAAIKLSSLIFQQSFRTQVAAVDVTNFRGRKDRARDHILVWPKRGRPIVWGSAIGEEIEEPVARDKLRNLAKYFASGSPQAYIDLSVYSNAGIERVPDAFPSADGLASSRKQ
jgi:hypothetical protein